MSVINQFRLNTLTGVPLLRLLLANEGMEPPKVDLQRAWPIFKYFAALPSDSEGDIVGFQGRWLEQTDDDPIMACTWLRQLTDEAAGYEVTRAIELDYTLDAPYNPAIDDIEIWSDSYPSLEEFFGEVEQQPHFYALSRSAATMCDIYAEDAED